MLIKIGVRSTESVVASRPLPRLAKNVTISPLSPIKGYAQEYLARAMEVSWRTPESAPKNIFTIGSANL